jgi:hypothetical protein
MPDTRDLRKLSSYALVALLTSLITFQFTRPSVAQQSAGTLHVVATPCFQQPNGGTGGNVETGFAGERVIAYVGLLACPTGVGQVRYIVLYQN